MIDFPANPTNGQVYGNWIWDSSITSWRNVNTDTGIGALNAMGLKNVVPGSIVVGSGSATVNGNGFVTFSNVTNLQLNNIFSSTYKSYRMIINITANSATTAIQGQMVAAGTRSTTGYNNVVTVGASDNTTATVSAINSTTFGMCEVHVSSNTNLGSAELIFTDPFEARPTKIPHVGTGSNSGGFVIRRNAFASHTVATSYDGFYINVATGTASGTVQVFGFTS